MSPIGKSSNLDIMDTTTHTVFSENLGEGGEGGGGGLEDMPRVSTQKIPHRTLLESFGPPRINVNVGLWWAKF